MNNCPECKSSWVGGEIPDDKKYLYATTHWGRQIYIEISQIYDGACAVKCPDCNETFPVNQHPVFLELYEKYERYIYDKGRD